MVPRSEVVLYYVASTCEPPVLLDPTQMNECIYLTQSAWLFFLLAF